MQIVESWEDHNANSYAIVRYSKEELRKFPAAKKYEALWMNDTTSTSPELWSFGGSVGQRIAEFDTIEEAQDFLLKGISEYDENPDIWWSFPWINLSCLRSFGRITRKQIIE